MNTIIEKSKESSKKEQFIHITTEADKFGTRKSRKLEAKHRAHWTTATLSDINEENLNRGFTLNTEDNEKKKEQFIHLTTETDKDRKRKCRKLNDRGLSK